MQYKLGKKPARPDSIALKFGSYFFAAELPVVPVKFGHPGLVRHWGMLANDTIGDCVIAGGMHESMYWCRDVGAKPPNFNDHTAISAYSAITGYVPGDDSTDQGTDMQQAAAYRQKVGLKDVDGQTHKIDVYAALRRGDLSQLALATYLFGATGVGVQLPSNAEDQFDAGETWDIEGDASPVGGHYIPCVGRNSAGNFLFVSWGKLQAATPRWVQAYMDEGVAYVSREYLKTSGLSPEGYDLSKLESDLRVVT